MSLKQFTTVYHPVPDDLVSVLKPSGITVILELIRDAYFDLCANGIITAQMSENDITEEWFVYLQERWRNSGLSLVPIHEKQDKTKAKQRGKPPTIDCCFRDRWHKHSYFGVECKLVEADDQALCSEYINNGLKRFIDGVYNSRCSEGAMLGYVCRSLGREVAKQLQAKLDQWNINAKLEKSQRLSPFDEYYVSQHVRLENASPLVMHHFLLLFGDFLH